MPRIFALATLLSTLALATAAEGKIGVLYIERTFEGSEMVRGVQAELKRKAEQVGAQLDQIAAKLEELKAEIESTPASSPAHMQAQEQFEVLRLRRKLFLERSQEALHGEEVLKLKASYLKIREVLAEFAREEGYQLVLMAPLPEITAQGVQQLNLELATHSVLFHSDAMDITDAFTAYFNDTVSTLDQDKVDAVAPAGGAGGGGTGPVIDLDTEE